MTIIPRHYYDVQELYTHHLRCGHKHKTEPAAWHCLGNQDDPDLWGIYEHVETPDSHQYRLVGEAWETVT